MAMRLSFDLNNQVETPTFVLARRNGCKIGELSNLSSIRIKGSMTAPEMFFKVNKYDGSQITPYWDDVKDFKLVWCKEIDMWFEIKVNENHSDDVTKSVTMQRLGNAELSQTIIRNMEINTEEDILRDDYVQPTLFYNEDKPEASLLHRILDKTQHYTVEHIDEHLKGIQRVFSFNGKSVLECFDEIAEELDVLFVYNSCSDANGKPKRTISVYDLKNYCKHCGARGSFVGTCLNCGSVDITNGYGEDTSILVSKEDLGQDITITVNQDEVKNCYYLEGGDDLMTATIRNCNPNGTSYIWNAGTNVEDMDIELQNLLDDYNRDYEYYRDEYVSSTSSLPVSNYNGLVNKYNGTSEDINLNIMENSLVGYSPIMQYYYDAIDLEVYLQSGLLPNIVLQDTNAQIEAAKLTSSALSPVAVVDAKYMTLSNVSTAVLNAAKVAADPRYKIAVKNASFSGSTWTGNFTVTNYSDERDTCDSAIITVTANANYETYINQKLKKTLYNGTKGKYGSITNMLDMNATDFKAQLKKYNLVTLNSLNTCFTECLKLLSEQKIDQSSSELYSTIYIPIQNKISYVQAEVSIRESEVAVVRNMQTGLLGLKKTVNDVLDLETYLGDLWLDFCAYRREETFTNSNYISDYLTNKQLFQRANEFMDLAQYEIFKVSTYTHTIDTTLKNLLVIPEFKAITDWFECGNCFRIKDDDGKIYKLRLMEYEISFDNLENIDVTFSDASRKIDSLAPVKEILVNSSNIINNYNAVMNKTNSKFESINDSMTDVVVDSSFNNDYTYDSYYDVKDSIAQSAGQLTTDIIVVDGLIRTEIVDRRNADLDLSSNITQTAGQILSQVSATYQTITDAGLEYERLSSQISQTAGEISMKVSKGDVVSEINQSADSVKINADKIVISGETTINGDFCIDADGHLIIGSTDVNCSYARLTENMFKVAFNTGGNERLTKIGEGTVVIGDQYAECVIAQMLNGEVLLRCNKLNGETPITSANISGSHSHSEYVTNGTLNDVKSTATMASDMATNLAGRVSTIEGNYVTSTTLSSYVTLDTLTSKLSYYATASNLGTVSGRLSDLQSEVADTKSVAITASDMATSLAGRVAALEAKVGT